MKIEKNMSVRLCGIDLLKMVAMFFVVVNHAIWWGGYGLGTVHGSCKGVGLEFIDAICLCAVNCFVLASGWVMWRLDFKFKRIGKLWGLVVFYSVLWVLIAKLLNQADVALPPVYKVVLPIRSDSYWFFTQYAGLFFLMPVLNHLVRTMSPRQLKLMIVGGACLFSVTPFLLCADPLHLRGGYGVRWFAYLYVVAGAFASQHWFSDMCINKLLVVFVGCAIAALCGSYCSSFVCRTLHLSNRLSHFYSYYNSPLMLVQSIALLLVFARINPQSKKVRRMVDVVMPSVFCVYLIHSNGLFRQLTDWNNRWAQCFQDHSLAVACLIVFGIASGIFILSIAVDFCRRKVLGIVLCRIKGDRK